MPTWRWQTPDPIGLDLYSPAFPVPLAEPVKGPGVQFKGPRVFGRRREWSAGMPVPCPLFSILSAHILTLD